MTPALSELTDMLAQLLQEAESVSFYETLTVTREARAHDELPEDVLHAMLVLHDAPQTTDGARDILSAFFKGYSTRLTTQRVLAARPIILKDSGKVARAQPGDTLLIRLDERRSAGYQWQVTTL